MLLLGLLAALLHLRFQCCIRCRLCSATTAPARLLLTSCPAGVDTAAAPSEPATPGAVLLHSRTRHRRIETAAGPGHVDVLTMHCARASATSCCCEPPTVVR